MPPKVKNEGDSPSKSRFDTSPGNANGWLPATDWGAKETQRCIELLASLALENRSQFYTDEALKAWSYNGGSIINKKLQQILTKICKDHETNMPGPPAVRSPKKRTTASGDDDEDKKLAGSPKKPRKQAIASPKKQSKVTTAPEAGAASSTTDDYTLDASPSCNAAQTLEQPVTPSRKEACQAAANHRDAILADSSGEEDDEDERPFEDRGGKEEDDS